jgi:hypothetical protein
MVQDLGFGSYMLVLICALMAFPTVPMVLEGNVQGNVAGPGHTPLTNIGTATVEVDRGTSTTILTLVIEPRLEPFVMDGVTYHTVDLGPDTVICGPYGCEEHFVSTVLELRGEVLDVNVELSDKVLLRAYPTPYIVPGTISGGGSRIHPEWKGFPDHEIEERFETVLLSSDAANGVRTYAFRSFPVRYGPDGTAAVPTKVVITVTWSPSKKAASFLQTERKPLGGVDYLMITHESLLGPVQTLADWKSQKGVQARVVTVQEISKMYPTGDEQSKVRRFVMEMEQKYDLDYLLLVGDYDKVRTRTTRNIHPETSYGEPSTFATDGYFACVDNGTTWDTNGNKVYGEGNEIDDPIPDLAVGRLAVNDPAVLTSVIDGLISRELSPSFSERSKEAIFMAGDPANVPGDPTTTLDFFWTEYCDDVLDGRETLYYDGSGTMAFSSSSFRSVVGTGNQAICYFAHGTQTGLPDLFSNNLVGTLSDTGPDGSMFAMACLTGWFDDPNQGSMGSFTDCFAEVLTETPDRGLAGYIGSSRLAVGYIDTDYSGDAPGLEEDYWRGIRKAATGEVAPTVGDVYRYAVTHFSESFHPFPTNYNDYSAQRTFLEYNLLGEPEAPLFLCSPDDLHMVHTLSPYKDWVSVVVTNRTGAPVEGANVALYRSGELGLKGTTDQTGSVNLSIPASNGGVVNLTAWKLGDRPANTTIQLPDTLEPMASYTIYPKSPDGLEGCYISTPEIELFADEGAVMEYSWDGLQVSTVPFGTKLPAPEGMHVINFTARDPSGRRSDPIAVTIDVDLTLPQLRAVTDPPGPDGSLGWFISPLNVNLTSDEPLFGKAYRRGSGPFNELGGPVMLGNGEHELTFKARDAHGNWNITNITVNVDLDMPYSQMNVSYPPDGKNGFYRTQPTVRLEPFDDREANISYRWDGGVWVDYTMPFRPDRGVHLLEYRALDISGNDETPLNSAILRYDPDLPEVVISVSPDVPDGSNGYYITRPMVSVMVTDVTSDQGLEAFAALAPPGEGVDWTGSSIPVNGTIWIGDGDWFLYLMARDVAGNVRSLAPVPFKVDTDRPSMVVSLFPPEPDGKNGWYIDQPVVWLNRSSPGSVVRVEVDSVPLGGHLVDVQMLPEGVHRVVVYPIDEAGNTGDNWTFDYSCDLTDPTAAMALSRFTFEVGEPVEVSASSSWDLNGIEAYRFHLSDGRSTLWMDSSDWNWTFMEEGFHTVWVQVEDISGRTSLSEKREINITAPPDPPPNDNTTDDDVPIDPIDDDDDTSGDWDIGLLLKLAAAALMILIIAVLTIAIVRRRSIQEVEWEDDDDDIDELDSIEEADVLEELGEDEWDPE